MVFLSYFTRYYLVWFFFEILLEAHGHIRKMSANPLFSQRFQGCLYCLIFDFQGSCRPSRRRRRRDLNPRAAINDLLPFQGSPFNHLGTSAKSTVPESKPSSVVAALLLAARYSLVSIATAPTNVNDFFQFFLTLSSYSFVPKHRSRKRLEERIGYSIA